MSPEQLLAEAKRKEISQVALTDINNTSGILDFFRLAPKYDIKPVAGIDFRNGNEQRFIGIAKNHEGFYELNKFLTQCSLSGETIIPEKIPEFENVFVIYPASPLAPLHLISPSDTFSKRRRETEQIFSLRGKPTLTFT